MKTGALLGLGGAVAIATFAFALQASRAQEHAGVYTPADIAAGASIYTSQCAVCHGLEGTTVASVDMRRGQFRTAVTDDDLKRVIVSGVPNAGMPGFKFDAAQLNAVVSYIRMGIGQSGSGGAAVAGGDPDQGRAVFQSADAGCLSCHRVHGTGGRAGPDLSDIGAARTPTALYTSLTDPSSAMHPINRPVVAVAADGRRITGRRLNEDTYTVQLSTDAGDLLTLDKAKLKRFEISTQSNMPSYKDRLSPDAIRHVVAYLITLKSVSPPVLIPGVASPRNSEAR